MKRRRELTPLPKWRKKTPAKLPQVVTIKPPTRLPGPTTESEATIGSFHRDGPKYLTQFFKENIRCLSDGMRAKLVRYINENPEERTGSFCSATESPVLVGIALKEALAEELGVAWNYRHCLSAEISPQKRKFALAMLGDHIEAMTGDCRNMRKKVRDFKHGGEIDVPKLKRLSAGFPCQDVAKCNNNASASRDIVAKGQLRTGGVLGDGVLDYIDNHGEALEEVDLENVVGFGMRGKSKGPTPLDVLNWRLSHLDCLLVAFVLNPRLHLGFPQDRARLWMKVKKIRSLGN